MPVTATPLNADLSPLMSERTLVFEVAVPRGKPDGLSLEELRPYWGALCIVGSIPNHLTQETTSRAIVPKHNVPRYIVLNFCVVDVIVGQ